jgi:hypothetical protein
MRAVFIAVLLAASGWGQEPPVGPRTFALGDRATALLTGDWTEHRNDDLPPPFLLAGAAPRLVFSEFRVLENRKAWEVLKTGVSENPFIGSNPAALNEHIHTNGLSYLFYFFFPPSRNCLARAKSSLAAAEAAEESRREREEKQSDKKEKKERPPQAVSITQACEPAATPLDFYAGQVSSEVSLNSEGRARGLFPSFYVPPTERVEIDGKTFFIYEAQGQRYVDRPQLDYFNLPDEWQGARAFLFWAVGADTPFPFVRDPVRKNVRLVHVAYACLSTTGDARPAFLEKLRSIRFSP